ncbi:MAG: dual specificity protein phosphatase family protein [Candidatus Heimdallarchaeota archaeon]|nr:dual specificity protein phosphatase family protein [Candidatus Heimdallarchaeota archaeon]
MKSFSKKTLPPHNFSFLDDFIAGSARPYNIENLSFLKNQGIRYIVSATTKPLGLVTSKKGKSQMKYLFLQISNLPTSPQIKNFLELIREAKDSDSKVLVHCQFGQERTGILLAIYLMEFCKMSVVEAIKYVHTNRPTSLKSSDSIDFLVDYGENCHHSN